MAASSGNETRHAGKAGALKHLSFRVCSKEDLYEVKNFFMVYC
jgi:hypothetical protein